MHGVVTFVAQYLIILSILGTIGVFLSLHSKDKKIFIARLVVGGIIALVLAYLARKIYYDPRPFVAGHFTPYFSHSADNGFVSDHTLLSSFLAITIIFYNKLAGFGLLILAILIGSARVIAGVHHSIDIVAAIVISLLGSLIAWYLVKKFIEIRQIKSDVK